MIILKQLEKLSKNIAFYFHQKIGNEEIYFQTPDDINIANANKLLSIYKSYDDSIDDDSPDDDSIDDDSIDYDSLDDDPIDNNEIVENIFSFMPMEITKTKLKNINDIKKINKIKQREVFEWSNCIKKAKHHYHLAGIPYKWISNDGKVKIHKKARDLYLEKYEKEQKERQEIKEIYKEFTDELTKESLEKLKSLNVPTNYPILKKFK